MSVDDPTPPIILREPHRPGQMPPPDGGFVLRPEEPAPLVLHPGWAAVLAPGETPLWQGRPAPDPRKTGASLPLFVMGFIFLILALNAGFGPGLIPLLVIGYLIFRARQKRQARAVTAPPDRLYLVTDRAAYIARRQGEGLVLLQSLPITPALRLGLGPRSVSFAAGSETATEGFADISDAQAVHQLIRDIQKGQT